MTSRGQEDGGVDDKVGKTRVLEDVLDEVLSFNYRSLRTLRDIFLRPGTVALAFLDGDRTRYTPPMRVWFGVLTWMFLLSMVWGGWGEIIWRISGDGAAFGDAVREGRRDLTRSARQFPPWPPCSMSRLKPCWSCPA